MDTPSPAQREFVMCLIAGDVELEYGKRLLTRGKTYEVFATKPDGHMVRVHAENNKRRWFYSHWFSRTLEVPVQIESWQIAQVYGDEVCGDAEVVLDLTNGERRLIIFWTSESAKQILEERDRAEQWRSLCEPALLAHNVIVTRRNDIETITWMVEHLDNFNKLRDFSVLIGG